MGDDDDGFGRRGSDTRDPDASGGEESSAFDWTEGAADTSPPRGPDRPLGGRRIPGKELPDPTDGLRPALAWLAKTDNGAVLFVREMLVSVVIVLAVGLLLFGISGVWPPLVAVESGSMEPHLYRGDLVFVMDETRLSPDYAVEGTGVVTAQVAAEHDYTKFGDEGDVIVYRPYGSASETPVIHRAHFWVEEGENWYQQANPEYVQADSCEELRYCPAPYDGFITKGDNAVSNNYYDQARGISTPVKPQWVQGRAVFRVPWLGWVRLAVSDMKVPGVSTAIRAMDGPISTAYAV